jgi:hypothetical protein
MRVGLNQMPLLGALRMVALLRHRSSSALLMPFWVVSDRPVLLHLRLPAQ